MNIHSNWGHKFSCCSPFKYFQSKPGNKDFQLQFYLFYCSHVHLVLYGLNTVPAEMPSLRGDK